MDSQNPPSIDDHRLGRILLENPIVREEDLKRCLEIQALTGNSRMLGQILVEEGILTYEMLEEFLRVQAARRAHAPAPIAPATNDVSLNSLVQMAAQMGANDFFVCEGRAVTARVAGILRKLTKNPVPPPEIWEFVTQIFGPKALDQLAENSSIETDFSRPGIGFGRVCAFRHFEGIGLSLKLHPELARPGDTAGLPVELANSLQPGKGLVLIVGEARSGVSETLATCIAEVSKDQNRVVLVLDESFERPVPQAGAIVTRRKVGRHTRNYASGLLAAARSLPDVVVVADISHPESFDLALHVAESGRLVIAGYRARSVTQALRRACEGFPVQEQARARATVASLLRCAVAQQLIPDSKRTGLVLAHELLRSCDAVREVLHDANFTQLGLLLRLNQHFGTSMDRAIVQLLRAGRITFEDAFSRAEDKALLMSLPKETRSSLGKEAVAVLESFEKAGKGS